MRHLCFLASILLLAACAGFHPVYGVNKYTPVGAEEVLSQVDIGNIPDREGQYLRNQLIDRFYRSGGRPVNPRYTLSVSPVTESILNLDITKTSDSTRAQLRLNTAFTLLDTVRGEEIMQRNLGSIVSYNILSGKFATRVSEDNARLNALNDLADQIENQLSLYFKRQK